jgi:hypothetical protein
MEEVMEGLPACLPACLHRGDGSGEIDAGETMYGKRRRGNDAGEITQGKRCMGNEAGETMQGK